MGKIIEFVANNYVWFITISILLVFALIGYIVDTNREKNDLIKKSEEELDEESLEHLIVPEGKKLNETIQISKNINPEKTGVDVDHITNDSEETEVNNN